MSRPFGRVLIAIAASRAFIGLVILVAYDPSDIFLSGFCLVAFAIAQASDQLDGWIARNYSKPDINGYLQDSVSDKLLHLGCLLGVATYFPWVSVIVWILFVRETSILAVRVVTNDLGAALRKYKYQSVIYASCIRIGIILFISSTFFSEIQIYALSISYLALFSASIIGILNLLILIKDISKGESQQQ